MSTGTILVVHERAGHWSVKFHPNEDSPIAFDSEEEALEMARKIALPLNVKSILICGLDKLSREVDLRVIGVVDGA